MAKKKIFSRFHDEKAELSSLLLPPSSPTSQKEAQSSTERQLIFQVSLYCGHKGTGERQAKEQVWSDGVYRRVCVTVLVTVTGIISLIIDINN